MPSQADQVENLQFAALREGGEVADGEASEAQFLQRRPASGAIRNPIHKLAPASRLTTATPCALMPGDMAADSLWQLDAVSLAPARLREVTLTIRRGTTAVIGGPGAGKTSLLNLLAGFEEPDGGKIAGTPRVAWVPPDEGLWPHCTCREHLEFVGAPREKSAALLAALDLREKADARPEALSPGEQSLIAVARALASPSEVLVLDEPLVHVDPVRVGKYWQVVRDHLAATGASLVLATHDPGTAIGEAREVICLRGGRVLFTGATAQLYAEPPDEELMNFLGPGNWLTPEEARRWLRLSLPATRCLRPEQLTIAPVSGGPLQVEASRYRGGCAEVELRHVPSHAKRTFFHRPSRDELAPGAYVQLATLLP